MNFQCILDVSLLKKIEVIIEWLFRTVFEIESSFFIFSLSEGEVRWKVPVNTAPSEEGHQRPAGQQSPPGNATRQRRSAPPQQIAEPSF